MSSARWWPAAPISMGKRAIPISTGYRMLSGPIGSLFHSGSSVWPAWESTSTRGISRGADRAPGPSFPRSSSLISHRLRNPVRADEAEVDVHQQHNQGRQQKDVGGEEYLQGGRADHRTALEHLFDEGAEKGRWS